MSNRLLAAVLGTLLVAGLTVRTQQPPAGRGQAAAAAPDKSSIIILGAGSPNITADRSGTSIGVVVRGTLYIFDAGAGVERRVLETRAKSNIRIERFGPTFISHLHSDHTLGLPAMLYYDRERNQPFTVFGPPGIKNMMDHILAAYAEDRDMRINGLEHAAAVRWETRVTELTGGVAFKDENVTVRAFEVPHGSWQHALGYRIDAPDRSIVISGDTRSSDAVADACNGCDVLFHEVGDRAAGPGPVYMAQFHTTPSEIGAVANRAKAKLVVLYHPVLRQSPADAVREVMSVYHGPVMFARDLDVF
jgi:ribonuclease BN (tRNA processing enzyme)